MTLKTAHSPLPSLTFTWFPLPPAAVYVCLVFKPLSEELITLYYPDRRSNFQGTLDMSFRWKILSGGHKVDVWDHMGKEKKCWCISAAWWQLMNSIYLGKHKGTLASQSQNSSSFTIREFQRVTAILVYIKWCWWHWEQRFTDTLQRFSHSHITGCTCFISRNNIVINFFLWGKNDGSAWN